jgi:twitching motility protein PilT
MLSDTLKAVICQNLLPRANNQGRAALFEVMMGNLGVRNLIRDNKTYQIMGQMQIGESAGHQTVDTALSRLLDEGVIAPEAAWLRADNKERFEHRVSPEFLAGQAAR